MPQLDFTTSASQIFWLIVTFCTLYLIMARSALPSIREVLHNRQSRISDDLKKAEKLKTEAEAAEADFTSVITEARNSASTMLHDARAKADAEAVKQHAKLDETFARQAKESGHRVEVLQKEAADAIKPVAVDAAVDMVNKLIGVNIDKAKIEQAMSSLSGKL